MAIKHPSRRRRNGQEAPSGFGGPVGPIDPTENVKALSEALSDRQDDLRELNNKYLDARLDSMEKNAIKDAAHAKEIRELESKRVDAVREIDVIARNTAAAQALTAIQTLAASTSAEREALRSLVSATATTIAAQTDRIVGAMTDRIAILEKTSYTGQGKQAIVDPQITELVASVNRLMTVNAGRTGKGAGIEATWLVIVAVIGLALSGLLLYNRTVPPTTPGAPQVIYLQPGTMNPVQPPPQR